MCPCERAAETDLTRDVVMVRLRSMLWRKGLLTKVCRDLLLYLEEGPGAHGYYYPVFMRIPGKKADGLVRTAVF